MRRISQTYILFSDCERGTRGRKPARQLQAVLHAQVETARATGSDHYQQERTDRVIYILYLYSLSLYMAVSTVLVLALSSGGTIFQGTYVS